VIGIALAASVPVALIMGLLTRGPKEGVINTDSTDPLHDPEMDKPRETPPAHGRT
jgi:hypothetical protein